MGRRLGGAACVVAVVLACAAPANARIANGYNTGFMWPADGILSSPFGPRWSGFHPGIDIGSLQSLTVRAASDGRVVATGAMSGYEGYGNVVVLDIGGGFTTLYGHLSRAIAQRGAEVRQGDVIGIAGCTGWCTGTHLHFELRDHAQPMDPLTLFGGYTPR